MPKTKIQSVVNALAESSLLDFRSALYSNQAPRQNDYCQGYQTALEDLVKQLKAIGCKIEMPSLILDGFRPSLSAAKSPSLKMKLQDAIDRLRTVYNNDLDKSAGLSDYDLEYTEGRIGAIADALSILEPLIKNTKPNPGHCGPDKSTDQPLLH